MLSTQWAYMLSAWQAYIYAEYTVGLYVGLLGGWND